MDANGNFQVEDVGIVYATGKVSITLDGSVYSHADLGRCVFSGDTPEALDMALAGSVTDCLKRCFRQLGDQFGNTLYDKEIAQIAGTEPSHTGNTGASDLSSNEWICTGCTGSPVHGWHECERQFARAGSIRCLYQENGQTAGFQNRPAELDFSQPHSNCCLISN